MKLSCLTRRAAPANNRLYLLKPVLLMLQASSSGVVCVLVRIFFYNAQLSRMSHCARLQENQYVLSSRLKLL